MLLSRHRARSQGPTVIALALWLAVAGGPFGFAGAPALAVETEAAEAPAADPDQPSEAPPVADGDAPQATDPEPDDSPSSDRPRRRVIRPDVSDLDDAVWDTGPESQEALAGPDAKGGIVCVAGCAEAPGSTVLAHGQIDAPRFTGTSDAISTAAEPAAPARGAMVCVAGC